MSFMMNIIPNMPESNYACPLHVARRTLPVLFAIYNILLRYLLIYYSCLILFYLTGSSLLSLLACVRLEHVTASACLCVVLVCKSVCKVYPLE